MTKVNIVRMQKLMQIVGIAGVAVFALFLFSRQAQAAPLSCFQIVAANTPGAGSIPSSNQCSVAPDQGYRITEASATLSFSSGSGGTASGSASLCFTNANGSYALCSSGEWVVVDPSQDQSANKASPPDPLTAPNGSEWSRGVMALSVGCSDSSCPSQLGGTLSVGQEFIPITAVPNPVPVGFSVYDQCTSNPIQGATVSVSNYSSQNTNSSGQASFSINQDDDVNYSVNANGYNQSSGSFNAGSGYNADIFMVRSCSGTPPPPPPNACRDGDKYLDPPVASIYVGEDLYYGFMRCNGGIWEEVSGTVGFTEIRSSDNNIAYNADYTNSPPQSGHFFGRNPGTVTITAWSGGPVDPATLTVMARPVATSISGTVFNDINENGAVNSGESGIAGVTIYLCGNVQDADCSGSNIIRTTQSQSNGSYTFSGLVDGGVYNTKVAYNSGQYAPTTDAAYGPFAYSGSITVNFGLRSTLSDIRVLSVDSNNQPFTNGSWSLRGPGCNIDDTGSEGIYTCTRGNSYTLTATNASAYNVSVSPSATQTLGSTVLTWTLTYTEKTGTVSAKTSLNSGGWAITGPANRSCSINTNCDVVQNLTLPVGNYVFTVTNLPSYVEYVRVGNSSSNNPNPHNFTVQEGQSVSLTGYYDLPVPANPGTPVLGISRCGDLAFSWPDNSNPSSGTENFRIWYEGDNGGTPNGNRVLVGTRGANGSSTATYTWTGNNPQPAVPATPVWIFVQTYIDYGGGLTTESAIIRSSSAFTAQPCYADLSSSTKEILYVKSNNITSNYNPNIAGKDGDILTFRILIENRGTDNATITQIEDVLRDSGTTTPQLVKPAAGWNLRISKDGDSTYNESAAEETGSMSDATTHIISISGSGLKCTSNTSVDNGCNRNSDPSCTNAGLCDKWAVMFDAQVRTAVPDVKTEVWNEATIRYTQGGVASNRFVQSTKYLINASKPKVPQFREIAP